MSEPIPPQEPATSLREASERIDRIDAQIQKLIDERSGACAALARLKREAEPDARIEAYALDQQAHTLQTVTTRNSGLISNQALQAVFREIIAVTMTSGLPLKVAYLGPEGTYSHAAADAYFGHAIDGLAQPVIADIFSVVESGQANFGVVPVENSTEGAVNQTLDLLTNTSLRVCGEIGMRIQHCLLSKASSLGDVKEVHAHPQALAQCAHWLNANLPNASRISESSNAAAAKLAIKRTDIAAIASETAAELYSLDVMVKSIEDEKNNTTRFLIIGDQEISPSGDDASLLLVSAPHKPGGLRSMLGPLEEAGVSMTRIESRPSRSALWEYVFFINVRGHEQDPHLAKVLMQLRELSPLVKVLGSYPRAL